MKRRTLITRAGMYPAASALVGSAGLLLGSVEGHAQGRSGGTAAERASPVGLVTTRDGRRMAPEMARIVETGVLKVALPGFDAKPFVYGSGEKVAGTDVLLIQEIARYLKVEVSFNRSPKTFNEVVDLTSEGTVDLGAGKLSRTVARALKVRYTDPYLSIRHAVLANRQALARFSDKSRSVSSFKTYEGRLGVLGGTAYEEFARVNFAQAKLESYKSWPQAVKDVKEGRLPFLYRDEFEVRSAIKSDPTLALTAKAIMFNDLKAEIAMVLPFGSDNLLNFINEVIALRRATLSVEQMLKSMED